MATEECTTPTPTKRCTKCGEEKPATREHFYSRSLGCFRNECKDCQKAGFKQWRQDNHEYNRERKALYYSTHKEETRARDLAYRATHEEAIQKRQAAYYATHAEENNARCAIYRATHTEEIRARSVAYYAKHREEILAKKSLYRRKRSKEIALSRRKHRALHPEPYRARYARRKARKRHHVSNFTAQDWRNALDYWDGCCAVCGQAPSMFWLVVADHWQPLASPNSLGDTRGNIVPLCHSVNGNHNSCNLTKGARDPVEWLTAKLGARKAKKKLKEIEVFLAVMDEG